MNYRPGDKILSFAFSREIESLRVRDPEQWSGALAAICLAAAAFKKEKKH